MPRKSHPIWDIGLFSKDTRKDGAKTRHCAICLVCKENNVFQVSNGSVKSLIAHLDSEKHKGSWFHRKYHELMKEKKEIGNSTNINPMHNRWSSNNNCSCTTSPILKPTHLDFCVALRNQQLINQNFSSGFCTNAEQYALDTAKFFSALCIPFEYPVSEVTIGSNASPFSSTFSETNLQFKSSSHIWERQVESFVVVNYYSFDHYKFSYHAGIN